MASYRRVYDSHHLQADCQEPAGSAPEPYTLALVWCAVQTQTNIYEIVIEMNIRQLNVERRTNEMEVELCRIQVRQARQSTLKPRETTRES